MTTIKQDAMQAISTLPETATSEEIMYRVYVLDCIRRGDQDFENGHVITQEELEKQSEQW